MASSGRDGGRMLQERSSSDLLASLVLSYFIAILLYAVLIFTGGVWNQLANTRLLSPLLRGGVVALTDADAGFILGVPDLKYYVASQDPVKWELVLLAAAVFALMWWLKSLQFNDIARAGGLARSTGENARAYLYGVGMNRFLPFNGGAVASSTALAKQGATLTQAAKVVYVSELFLVFELVFFSILGIFLLSWTTWLALMFWALVILAASYLFVYGRHRRGAPPSIGRGAVRNAAATVRGLMTQPGRLLKLALLSIIAFALKDVAAYVIAMAFSSPNIIMHPDPKILLMAIVAGHIARFIPVTPGGIGQFEWAFAAALYIGGMGMPEAVSIAVLFHLMDYVVSIVLLGAVSLRYGAGADTRQVLRTMRRTPVLATEIQR